MEDNPKYVEIVEPLVDSITTNGQPSDYKITRVEIGKQTCLSCQQDAQDAVAQLTRRNDKLWEKKNKMKEENARLLEVINMMNNSQNVAPISVSHSGCYDKYHQKAKAMDEWGSRLESQGLQVIQNAIKVFEGGREVSSKLNELITSFDQQLRFLDADLDVWRSMTEISLDDLCAFGIISSAGMYCDFLHLMVNKEQVLQGLKIESHEAVERLTSYENMINGVFHQLRCQLIMEGGELIEDKAVLAMFTKVIRLQLEADNFDFDMIDVLTGYKTSLDHLQSQLIEYKNAIAESTDLNQKVRVIAQHTRAPNEAVVRESLQKFADFVNTV